VHRIAALQSEYSLWARDQEPEVLPVCVSSASTCAVLAPVSPARTSAEALAWLLAKGDDLAPFQARGASLVEENIAADSDVLSAEQMKRLDELTPASGGHHNEAQMEMIER
jgi:aryl-alcohol dehydrogenase-like predicted oxidoreductase